MTTISQRELRNDSGEVLRRVEAGEAITVTRRGVPVVDLVPHRVRVRPHRFAPAALVTVALNELPGWGAEDFEREQNELDSRVDDGLRDPWNA